jgi:hypothetical protein
MPNESELDVKHQLRERKEEYYEEEWSMGGDSPHIYRSSYGSSDSARHN